MTLLTRAAKGAPLTNNEGDANTTEIETRLQALEVPLSAVLDVTRNSANDATDANEVTMATFTIPAGVLQVGSMFDVVAIWESSNSANVKNFIVRVNGAGVSSTTATANQSTGMRQPFHVHDAATLLFLNNGTVGTGSAAGLASTTPFNNVANQSNTVTLTCKWTAQPIAGEFIRLKHAKLVLVK